MMELSPFIADYLHDLWWSRTYPAYLLMDRRGYLADSGGALPRYGLDSLSRNRPLSPQLPFLEGMLPVEDSEPLVLPCLEFDDGHAVCIHLMVTPTGSLVLLLDAEEQCRQTRHLQQMAHDLHLTSRRQEKTMRELEDARAALRMERDKARQASHLKGSFIAGMSHEMRTPLTSVLGYARLLAEPKVFARHGQEYLRAIETSGQHLLALLDNVLDEAILDAGQLALYPAPVSLQRFAATIEELFSAVAQEQGLAFSVALMPLWPPEVMVDEVRLRQVVINLVNNALKFTSSGSVNVMLLWNKGRLEVRVEDTGPGIAAEAQGRIFQAFHREAGTKDTPGAGLGLSIGHRLVDLMGGHMGLRSRPGEGAVFYFSVPAPEAEDLEEERQDSSRQVVDGPRREAEPAREQAKVLVCDDNGDIRSLLEVYLGEWGYRVVTAADGVEALRLAREVRPDLALMDAKMPAMSGFEVVAQLRQDGCGCPIVMLTAATRRSDEDRARACGCNDVLLKPVDFEQLRSVVHNYVYTNRGR